MLIGYACFHLYTSGFGLLPSTRQKAVHVVLAIVLALLMYSATKRSGGGNKVPIRDIIFAGLVIAACVNVFIKYLPFTLSPTTAALPGTVSM